MNLRRVLLPCGLVLFASAFALIHAARNRAAGPLRTIELTDRELPAAFHHTEDDSGLFLNLSWQAGLYDTYGSGVPWLTKQKLAELGFDVARPPRREDESRYREDRKMAYIAFELEGQPWQAWLEKRRAQIASVAANSAERKSWQASPEQLQKELESQQKYQPRLFAIDAARDPATLERKYPDARRYLIAAGVVTLIHVTARNGRDIEHGGILTKLPVDQFHVPKQYARKLQNLQSRNSRRDPSQRYRVKLCQGSYYEPWVCGVDAPQESTPGVVY